MRRGKGTRAEKVGGALQCAAITRIEESVAPGPSVAGINASTTDENETLLTDADCTKAGCIDGMVLQQSWLCA
jgi:hypothetical protein